MGLGLRTRTRPRLSDIRALRRLVESTDVFYPEEVEIAMELLEERLRRGAKSGYEFIFAERAGELVGYCVWGAVPGIVELSARAGVPLVVMHNRNSTDYAGDCVDEVLDSLGRSAEQARQAGVAHVIIDPGIGFGKTADQNVELLGRLGEFTEHLPYPLLVGTSRKSFIGKITGLPVEERAFGTAASIALAIAAGADIVRIHDVEKLIGTVEVADAICRVGSARSARPSRADTPAAAAPKP